MGKNLPIKNLQSRDSRGCWKKRDQEKERRAKLVENSPEKPELGADGLPGAAASSTNQTGCDNRMVMLPL